MVSYSAMRRTSLADRREYLKDTLNTVTFTPSDTQGMHLVEENTNIAVEVFLAVKILKTGKAAECDEIRHEMLKALNKGVLRLARLCQSDLEGHQRIGKVG